MRPKILNYLTKKTFLAIFALLIFFSFNSTAKKSDFLTSSLVPAARGYAKISRDKNKNYVIKIRLIGLAEVQRLQASKQAYVVWMVTDQETTKNIGQINSTTSVLSEKLKATFHTVSSFRPVKFFITAEEEANTQYPGTQIVLSTDRFWN
jgi:hypothetical protein